ncbi:MAG: hypothetical protein ACOX81_07675 [Candidatus Heteroscillospira sp.]
MTQLVYAAALGIFRQDSTFLFLSAALPVGTGLYLLILNVWQTCQLFTISVQMGRTRRESIKALLAFLLLESALAFALSLLLVQIDALITYCVWYRVIPGLAIHGSAKLLPVWGVALAAVCVPPAGFALGAGMRRWGSKFMWVLWACWMVFTLLPNRSLILLDDFLEWNKFLLPIIGIGLFIWALRDMSRATVK